MAPVEADQANDIKVLIELLQQFSSNSCSSLWSRGVLVDSPAASQLLVPLANSERRALNKRHDARCLVHDEVQHPRFGLMLDRLPGQVAKVQDCNVKNF